MDEYMVPFNCPNPTGHSGDCDDERLRKRDTISEYERYCGGADTAGTTASVFFVPLQFWFCRNPGLALPLIALQYHEVKVILNHHFSTSIYWTFVQQINYGQITSTSIQDERRRFAQVSHGYLIEQVQEQTVAS